MDGQVTFVTSQSQVFPAGTTVVQCGNKNFVTCNIQNFDVVKNKLDSVEGFSLRPNNLDYKTFVNDFSFKVVKKEKIDDKEVVYGFSKSFNNYIVLENKFANVQLVLKDGIVQVVGVPVILDSF